ncbi:GIN domain-containing protein [Snuella lapsa]|uniref:Putative auto-transporter adhesin head GIN domain-containing protein n=1 Tax=Snuella lapsa TaxID=870481 RepID=A0ABP6YFS9_9FLAO
MTSNSKYIMLCFLTLIVNACSIDTVNVQGSDVITTKSLNVSDFSHLEVNGNFNVYVKFSQTETSIDIEANSNLHKYITTVVENDKLNIRVQNNIFVDDNSTLNIYITTKALTDFKAVGSSNIYLQSPLVTDNAKIKLLGDCLFLGELAINNTLQIDASSDSTVDLLGNVNILEADLVANTKLLNYNLQVEHLKLKMFADCMANITVNSSISIEAMVDCILYYKGNATILDNDLSINSKLIKVD